MPPTSPLHLRLVGLSHVQHIFCIFTIIDQRFSQFLSFFLQFLQRFFSFSIDLLYKTSTLSLYSDSLRILSLTPFVNYILVWLCSCLNSNFSLRFFKFFNLASMSNIWLLVWLSWLLTWLFLMLWWPFCCAIFGKVSFIVSFVSTLFLFLKFLKWWL